MELLISFQAFFGIIDLLAILPYYIEIALQVDTVCLLPIRSILDTDVTVPVFNFSLLYP